MKFGLLADKASPYFSSVATWFALQLRSRLHVPVGIVSCSLGGTSASAWMEESYLKADSELKIYTDEYEQLLKELDICRYNEINRMVRSATGGKAGEESEDFLNSNIGVSMQDFFAFQMSKKSPEELMKEICRWTNLGRMATICRRRSLIRWKRS